jgi:hypothetical protein
VSEAGKPRHACQDETGSTVAYNNGKHEDTTSRSLTRTKNHTFGREIQGYSATKGLLKRGAAMTAGWTMDILPRRDAVEN